MSELSEADILRIAAEVGADPRTVRAVADGADIRGKHKLDRIRRAIGAIRGAVTTADQMPGVVRGDSGGPGVKRGE